jgi:flagellar basal-body rod protein FlgG
MASNAMFTAVTGAGAQQIRIDIISNNLANLGTTGYKAARPQFEDLLYQTVKPAVAQGGSSTGLQIGRGTRVVSTERLQTPGVQRTTGQALDIAIDGRGFFAVQRLNGDLAYTRDGSFKLDAAGTLVNNAGLPLDPPITIPQDATEVQISADGIVSVRQPGSATLSQVGQLQIFVFPNEAGLSAVGGNLLLESDGSGAPLSGTPGTDAFGLTQQGSLEEANVNIAEELVNLILAQRAFEANTRVISTSDDILRFVTQR